jgi:hypothetical protein
MDSETPQHFLTFFVRSVMISGINNSLGGLLTWATVQFAIAQVCDLGNCEAQHQELSCCNFKRS